MKKGIRKIINLSGFILLSAVSQLNGISQDSISFDNPHQGKFRKSVPVLTAVALTYAGGLVYTNTWYYPEDSRVPFYFSNDNSSYLQVDKCQHAFGSYMESYFGYTYLRSIGVRRNNALLLGGTLGFLMQTPKEFIDAHFGGAGFSWGDVTGNFAGSLFMIGQELLFDEQLLRYKFSYWRSPYADQANGLLGRNFFQSYSLDYNSHTYWLSLNANKIFLKNRMPDWISIAFGYSANGMFGPYENRDSYNGVIIPETVRYRQYLLSLDIDWPRIKTRSKLLKLFLNGIVFIKMPFPALEFNSKGQIKGYWLYF
jgi:uncharacterized protein YfiM (DUF2279 family)